ncbi:MAG: hypothetical protein M5U32_13005 [Myxococcota bacterium]|nr:hypothetical protein [Myxococcota bacterium]
MERRRRIEIVSVLIQLEHESARGKDREVERQGGQIDERTNIPDHRHTQRQQHERADRERDPGQIGELRPIEPLHPDVVVQRVDLLEIAALVAGLDRVRVDVEFETRRVLRRHHADVPERVRETQRQRDHRQRQQHPRPRHQRTLECTKEAIPA